MLFLIYSISANLLRCVYCACSWCDDNENTIYQSALTETKLTSFIVEVQRVSEQRVTQAWFQNKMTGVASETSRDALVYAVQPATAMKNSGGVPGHSVIPDEQVMLEHTGKKLKNNPM